MRHHNRPKEGCSSLMKPLACITSMQIRGVAPPQWCNYAPQLCPSIWKSPVIKPDSGLISSLLIHCEVIFELSPDGCQVYAASEIIFPSRWHWFLHTVVQMLSAFWPCVSLTQMTIKIYVSDRYLSRSAPKCPNRHLWKHLLHSSVPTHLRVARGASGAAIAPLSETDAPLHALCFSP